MEKGYGNDYFMYVYSLKCLFSPFIIRCDWSRICHTKQKSYV